MYDVDVASRDIMLIPNFVKIGQLVSPRQHSDVVSLCTIRERMLGVCCAYARSRHWLLL
jgi:hypothetical protein